MCDGPSWTWTGRGEPGTGAAPGQRAGWPPPQGAPRRYPLLRAPLLAAPSGCPDTLPPGPRRGADTARSGRARRSSPLPSMLAAHPEADAVASGVRPAPPVAGRSVGDHPAGGEFGWTAGRDAAGGDRLEDAGRHVSPHGAPPRDDP